MFNFPAKFQAQPEGGYSVSFRDLPRVQAQGETFEEAQEKASQALIEAMQDYRRSLQRIPVPSEPLHDEEVVSLPLSAKAKAYLLNEMVEQQRRPTDLAEMMGITRQEVNRLLDMTHATKIDTVVEALSKLGRTVMLEVSDPPARRGLRP